VAGNVGEIDCPHVALTKCCRSDPTNDWQIATALVGKHRLESDDERRACSQARCASPEHTDLMALMFPGALGMAAGGWLAGALHDAYGFYAPPSSPAPRSKS
jgi:hypothetical protein